MQSGELLLEIKGITLNSSNREKINFEMWRILMLVYVINPDSVTLKKVITEQHYNHQEQEEKDYRKYAPSEYAEGDL